MNVRISDIIEQVEPAFGQFTEEMASAFKEELLEVFRNEVADEVRKRLMAAYDELAELEESQMGTRVRGKDPINLKNLRHLFERQIHDELRNLTRIEGDFLIIEVMDKGKLGFNEDTTQKEGFPDTADTLSFYVQGIAGAFAFITPEHYEKMRGERRPLGRVGEGFLMPIDRYRREGWERKTGIPFSEVQHSISGQSPYSGFNTALARIDYSPYIMKAVENIQQKFQGASVR